MKIYDDTSNLIKESSQSYRFIRRKERKATRNLLNKILEGEYAQFFEEISPYLLPFYKDLIPKPKTS